MKKRVLTLATLFACLFIFTACNGLEQIWMGMASFAAFPMVCTLLFFGGEKYETDPKTYSEAMRYLDSNVDFMEPGTVYFPESINEYTVNGYSYTRYEYMDICVEVFVDLTVSETQLDELLDSAYNTGFIVERDAYYAEGYKEIVFQDEYVDHNSRDEKYYSDEGVVGQAFIQKVIYNSETNNIVYEFFYGFDTGVYELKDVAYFNRFGVDPKQYEQHTITNDEQEKI